MNCTDARELIEAREGRIGDEHALRDHVADCPQCRQLQRQAAALRVRIDELPSSMEPPRDLWDGIRGRIDGGSPRTGQGTANVVKAEFGVRPAATPWRRWGLYAAAAMLLVTVSSGMTAWILGSSPTPVAPAQPAGAATAAVSIAWDQFRAAEGEYQKVADELLQTLESRRDRLAPETIRVVEDNLRLIDEAIDEARSALEQDPSNAALATQLTDIYRRRVGFLQQMSRL